MAKIRAQYIGTDDLLLADVPDTLDGNGDPLTKATISTGDILMMADFDVLGQTFLYDSMGGVQNLGLGRVILPQDDGLSDFALSVRGYTFSTGRSDFVAV